FGVISGIPGCIIDVSLPTQGKGRRGRMPRHSHLSDIARDHAKLRADLEEALAAIEFVGRALERSAGDGFISGVELSALAVVERIRRKHNRSTHPRIDVAA